MTPTSAYAVLQSRRRSLSAMALGGWCLLSGLFVVHVSVALLVGGRPGLMLLIQEGPNSQIRQTLIAVALSWALLGLTLGLVALERFTARNALSWIGFLCVAFLYVNVTRELMSYGDVRDYIEAASNLYAGAPLPPRYLYPPLWASVLSPLAPLGPLNMFLIIWVMNLLSLFVMYFLLQRVLERYGFSSLLASLVVFLFFVANAPILRTLNYLQINFHVVNLVLVCLLCYPRYPFVSALALAIAAHLKLSPLALAVPFLVARDRRWLGSFALCLIGVALVPAAMHGLAPYVDSVRNLGNISTANPLSYRETSIDSLVRAIVFVAAPEEAEARPFSGLVYGLKLLLVAACLGVGLASVRGNTFVAGRTAESTVYNMTPPLLILMVMVSPLVWEHHPVLFCLSYLVLLKRISKPRDGLLFGVAYFLEYLMPTFDFVPWSYGRLVSPLMWLALAWSLRDAAPSELFVRANAWLSQLRDSLTHTDVHSSGAAADESSHT